MSSGKTLEKCPIYQDLDALMAMDLIPSQIKSATIMSSFPAKKKSNKNVMVIMQDLGYPPTLYNTFLWSIAINYYCPWPQESMRATIMEKGESGIMCLQVELQFLFEKALKGSE